MNRDDYREIYDKLSGTLTRYTECIKIVRTDGVVFRFTALDIDLRLMEDNGKRYVYRSAASFKLSALETQAGLVVSNMDVDAIIDDDTITEADLLAGLFDNARVELFIAYWALGSRIRRLPLRVAWIGQVILKGVQFSADLRGIAQKLQQTFVTATSLECRFNFGDNRCGKNLSLFTREVEVYQVENKAVFRVDIENEDFGKFSWGNITWLTGQNAGKSMEIIRNHNKKIQLFLPMSYPVEVGDTVRLVYGCNKTFNTCRRVYDNARRFGGEPFLAGSDVLMKYPKMYRVPKHNPDEGGKG
jgi:uncharacterized phage protein (TIGR02218 family)